MEHLGGTQLRLTFTDGLVRELEFADVLGEGVFAELRDEAVFAQASVDAVAGTVRWPSGADLDPDVLHGDFQPATGPAPRLLREYRLRPTG